MHKFFVNLRIVLYCFGRWTIICSGLVAALGNYEQRQGKDERDKVKRFFFVWLGGGGGGEGKEEREVVNIVKKWV